MATNQKVNFLLTAQDRTRDAFDGVNRRLRTLDKAAVALAAGGMVAIAGGLALVTRRAFQTNDQLGKIADTIGIGTKELAGLRQAAELTGVGTDALDKALQKLTRSTGDAIRGTQTQVDAFERLGIEVEDFARLDPGEQFKQISDGLGGLATRGEQAAVAAALFGREGINMLNTLELGRGELERITAEMDSFGVALDRVDVAQIEAANDAFTRAGAAAQGIGNKIAVNLAPFIEAAADSFVDLSQNLGDLSSDFEVLGVTGGAAFDFIFERVEDLHQGMLTIQAGANGIRAVWNKLTGDTEEYKEALENMSNAFEKIREIDEGEDYSDKIRKGVAEIRDAQRERAEAVAAEIAARNKNRQGGSEIEIGESVQEKNARARAEDAAAAAAERDAQRAADKLLALEESLLTEEEAERLSYERRRTLVEDNLSTEGAEAERRAELLEGIEADHQERMRRIVESNLTETQKIERKTQADKLRYSTAYFAQVTAATAQHSKILFAINKAAAVADIAVNIPKTISDAYKHGTAIGGPPVGAAFAAVAGAAQAAQMSAVLSTSYTGGGGGTTPSSAGTTPVVNDQPVEAEAPSDAGSLGRSSAQIVINGNFYGNEEAISELMDAIEERISEGDQVLIDPGSRQAQAIRGG